MAISFPTAPSVGQVFVSGDKSWQFDGVSWKVRAQVASATNLKVGMTVTGNGISNINYAPIVFDGNTYYAMPIELSSFEIKSDGAANRPTLSIANIESILRDTSLFQNADDGGTDGITGFKLEDLIGKRFTQRQTLEKYLTSDPVVEFSKDVFFKQHK